MGKLHFQIYIAGKTARNDQLVRYYSEACQLKLAANSYDITVIDLAKHPKLAEQNRILATPTISRINPEPEKRIIGNLTIEGAERALTFLTEDLLNYKHG